jgi:hypothetical protein
MRFVQIFFINFTFILSLQFPASIDRKIRKDLLSALRHSRSNYHKSHSDSTNSSPSPKTILEKLPNDLITNMIGPFLDLKSTISLKICSFNSKEVSHSIVKARLVKFCPHFVFENLFLNDLLLYVLDSHFPESVNLSSPSIKDELQVLILKFNCNDLKFNNIPRNIYFYLIAFINEFVNGPNSTVPVCEKLCIIDSIRLISRSNFPLTLNYLRILRSSEEFSSDLDFFATKPSKEQTRSKFYITNVNSWALYRPLDSLFTIIVAEYFIDEYTTMGLLESCRNVCGMVSMHFCYHSPIIADRLISDINGNNLDTRYLQDIKMTFAIKHAICAKNSHLFHDCDVVLQRIIGEIPEHQNELSKFSDPKHVENILKSLKYFNDRSNLYLIDLFSRSINSLYLTTSVRDKYLINMEFNMRFFFFEAIVKEFPRPTSYMLYSVPESPPVFAVNYHYFSILPIFFELLKSNDPIILIAMLSEECFPLAKEFITDKFDLNRTYKFSVDGACIFEQFCDLFCGRTMHFKQIIQELHVPKIQEILSSNQHEFEGEFVPNYPVVLVDKHFQIKWFK